MSGDGPRADTPRADGPLQVNGGDIEAALQRIAPYVHRTPVLRSRSLDARHGIELFFKAENLQRMGAFKFRGAINALLQLSPEAARRGVLAYSSGNHAQAVALAGRELGIPTVIVMPEDAPPVKLAATREYGAEVITYDRQHQSREALSAGIAKARGLAIVPPFDHPHIVAGQGTAALELFEQAGELDWLFVPCGGAGLTAGCAIAASLRWPGCKVVGVEPAAGDDATRSFRSGVLHSCHNPDTIADGARTAAMGVVTFPLVMRHVHDMTTVDDADLLLAMRTLWERLKTVVEPTGALGAAAAFARASQLAGASRRTQPSRPVRVGVLLSGGNVDLDQMAGWFGRG